MWIMTNKGFISVVQHRSEKGVLIVRARNKEPLITFNEKIIELRDSDYRWRVFVTRGQFARWMDSQVRDIDYDNFKNSIKDKGLLGLAHKIWAAAYDFQTKRYGRQIMKTFVPSSYYDKFYSGQGHNYTDDLTQGWPEDDDVYDENELDGFQIVEGKDV